MQEGSGSQRNPRLRRLLFLLDRLLLSLDNLPHRRCALLEESDFLLRGLQDFPGFIRSGLRLLLLRCIS